MNIFVKNIPESINGFYLEQLFKAYGQVNSAKVLYDHATGEHKGIGFVEMENDKEGEAAIAGINGKEIQGKALVAEQARPRKTNIWG